MIWRSVCTALIWFLGLSFLLSDGQAFRNQLTVIAALLIGTLPWINLLFCKAGTRGRVAAILIVLLSVIAAVWVSTGLPNAYESQIRFNEERAGDS